MTVTDSKGLYIPLYPSVLVPYMARFLRSIDHSLRDNNRNKRLDRRLEIGSHIHQEEVIHFFKNKTDNGSDERKT
jgi:hypothetical protein